MINVLILEDNYITAKVLCNIIMSLEPSVNVEIAENIVAGYRAVMEKRIDLFIIDIVINSKKDSDVSGMEFAKAIRNIPEYKFTKLVFITSIVDEKLFAYSNIHCYSYIEKPFDMQKLAGILEDLINAIKFEKTDNKKECRILFIRKKNVIYPVEEEQIIYLENHSASCQLHLENESIKVSKSVMNDVISKLNNNCFIKCNRSDIVNVNYIEKIDLSRGYIILKGIETTIYLTKTGKNNLCEVIGI